MVVVAYILLSIAGLVVFFLLHLPGTIIILDTCMPSQRRSAALASSSGVSQQRAAGVRLLSTRAKGRLALVSALLFAATYLCLSKLCGRWAACEDVDNYLNIPATLDGDLTIDISVDTIACATQEVIEVSGGVLTLTGTESTRRVEVLRPNNSLPWLVVGADTQL